MTKKLDLTGEKFNKLTVIGRKGRIGSSIIWKCECECGKEHIATTKDLQSGESNPCDCDKQKSARKNSVNLTKDGITKTIPEWASELGIKPNTIHMRLRKGWSEEKALTPVRVKEAIVD